MSKIQSFFTKVIQILLYVAVVAVIVLIAGAVCSLLMGLIARCWLWAM